MIEQSLAEAPRIFDMPLTKAATTLVEANVAAGTRTMQELARTAAAIVNARACFLPEPNAGRAPDEPLLPLIAEHGIPALKQTLVTLELVAERGSDEQLDAVLEPFLNAPRAPVIPAFRLLVNAGRGRAAARVLGNTDALFTATGAGFRPGCLYGRKTAEALASFLPTLADPELRRCAEVLMAAAPDHPDLDSSFAPSRDQRTAAVVKSLTERKPGADWLRRYLSVLPERPADPAMAQLIEESVGSMDATTVMASSENLRTAWLAWMHRRTSHGDFQPLLAAVRTLNSADTGDPSLKAAQVYDSNAPTALKAANTDDQRRLRDLLFEALTAAMKANGPQIPGTVRPLILEISRTLAITSAGDSDAAGNFDSGREISNRTALCMALHALWNALPEWDKALDAIPESARRTLVERPRTASCVLRLLAADSGLPILMGERTRILAHLLSRRESLRGLAPMDLHAFVRKEKLDPAPLVAELPALQARLDTIAESALWDLARFLAEDGQPGKARDILPRLADALDSAGTGAGLLARHYFVTASLTDGLEAALTWILAHPDPILNEIRDSSAPDISVLEMMREADAARLKSAGQETWQRQIQVRMATAPVNALTISHAAGILENIAQQFTAAGSHREAFTAFSLAVLMHSRAATLSPAILPEAKRTAIAGEYTAAAERAGQKPELPDDPTKRFPAAAQRCASQLPELEASAPEVWKQFPDALRRKEE